MSSLLAFDLDHTLLNCNSSFRFCCYLKKLGILTPFDLYYCATLYFLHKIGVLSLSSLHQKVFRKLFFLKDIKLLKSHMDLFFDRILKTDFYTPILNRIKEGQRRGDFIILLSNSPSFLVEKVANFLGIELFIGTEYQIDNQGRLWDIAAIIDGSKKAYHLKKTAEKLNLTRTVAFSDSATDIPFLSAASSATVVRPHRALRKEAMKRGWEVIE